MIRKKNVEEAIVGKTIISCIGMWTFGNQII